MATDSQPQDAAPEEAAGVDPGSQIRVDIETFEGPFDLLLHLVRVDEMDVFDINVSEITDRYLAHLAKMEECDLEIAGEFLVMAATLVNIKSRTLLPENPHVEEEEEDDFATIQTTADLVRQLIEYRRFKEIAQVLNERELAQMRVHYRTHLPPPKPKRPDEEEEELPPQDIDKLLGAFAKVIELVGVDRHHEVFDDEANVEDALVTVRDRLYRDQRAQLSELLRQCRTRMQMVVTVLALLEMCKLGEIRLEQGAFYEDIQIAVREDQRLPEEEELLTPEQVEQEAEGVAPATDNAETPETSDHA